MAGCTVDPLVARLWFESVDVDMSGLLDAKELRQALDIGGLVYSLEEAHLFIRAFDSKGNQTLNVNEFVELHKFLSSVQDTFALYSRGGRALAASNAAQALGRMGFTLDPTALQAVLRRFDKANTGMLDVTEFLHACLFLRTAARAFQAFDTGRTGRVELNFNQFCYAASYLA
ncbi:hypothetical protein Agub_g1191 [Astrephomene gubernaculifera]|uniref:EF-hand domain-containing protein n=1 Tax=Astrephomene gubernaculifera TaxID=47775 RepID=A0AAD3HHJ0_9CHLO|nr:hypothetical protein Agub_g1191 [Astrephomene gubernaculifera]